MSIFSDIGQQFNQATGFGANTNPNPQMDPNAYSGLYNSALGSIQGVGQDQGTQQMTNGVEGAANSALANLQNNAAGAKSNFTQQMGQGFSTNMQNAAVAKGGTGGMAQAYTPTGSTYGQEATAESQGQQQIANNAVGQISSLNNVDNSQFNNQLKQAGDEANLDVGQQNTMLGIAGQDTMNNANATAMQQAQQGNTLGGIMSMFSEGGEPANRMNMKTGGQVPGQPKIPGNHPANDTVPAWLSKEEIVIPNSITQSDDPAGKGARFIAKEMAKSKGYDNGGLAVDNGMADGGLMKAAMARLGKAKHFDQGGLGFDLMGSDLDGNGGSGGSMVGGMPDFSSLDQANSTFSSAGDTTGDSSGSGSDPSSSGSGPSSSDPSKKPTAAQVATALELTNPQMGAESFDHGYLKGAGAGFQGRSRGIYNKGGRVGLEDVARERLRKSGGARGAK